VYEGAGLKKARDVRKRVVEEGAAGAKAQHVGGRRLRRAALKKARHVRKRIVEEGAACTKAQR
jgi:hypothetical protein